MPTIGNLICLTPIESYSADEPIQKFGLLGRLEKKTGPFVRSPGIGFPYMVGFFRQSGVLSDSTAVVVQHDKIEGVTSFADILKDKVDQSRGDHDVLFITAYTNSAREAYRRAREARAAYASAGRDLTIVLGGAHASGVPEEGTRFGHVDAVVVGEGEWAAAELLNDVREGNPIRPIYRVDFARIRDRQSLAIDMSIWRGLRPNPQQVVASSTLARGCKLDCSFCAVKLTNGTTVRNRDVRDVVDEIRSQGPAVTRENIDQIAPGFYNNILKTLVKMPLIGHRYGDRLIANMGPGYTKQFFLWDDNLYNAPGPFRALCEAVKPLGRTWSSQLTMDIAKKPELLHLAYESGCRTLLLGIESVNQSAIDGLGKWSNDATDMVETVRRVHDAGIQILGAFVFGLDGDDVSVFDKTLDFTYKTGIDFIIANIIQPYPGTGTFHDAVAADSFVPAAACPADADVAMDYNWALFDGAHVLIRPQGMSIDQLQEGYYYFLRESYSMTGMMRRSRSKAYQVGRAFSHCARNYLLSRYGMSKTMHAIWSRPRPKSPALAATPLPQTEPGPLQHPAKPVKPVPDPGI